MKVIILSADRCAGKTSWCKALADLAQSRGLASFGCLEFSTRGKDGVPWRIDLFDIAGGFRLRAAERLPDRKDIPFIFIDKSFHEIEQYVKHQLQHCKEMTEAICIIDEIGPLELVEHRGHYSLFMNIMKGTFPQPAMLILTVRPALCSQLVQLIEDNLKTQEIRIIDPGIVLPDSLIQ